VHCHRGGNVLAIAQCGDLPAGAGGNILPGAYTLTEYASYGSGSTYPAPGVNVTQTLYLTESSLLLISDDSNNFYFTGNYRSTVDKNQVTFETLCESTLPQYRAFPAEATFTATTSTLELFDTTRQVRTKYTKIE
jgi:hypothetical protein